MHLAMIKELIDKQYINAPTRILNIDESGFSTRVIPLGRSKCSVRTGTRGKPREKNSEKQWTISR